MNNTITLKLTPAQYALIMRCLETTRMSYIRNEAIDLHETLTEAHGNPGMRGKHTLQRLQRKGKADEGAVIIEEGKVEA